MALAKHSDTFSENQGNTFSRRNFLTTAPVFSFASLMASGATAADETNSEIMRLYREIKAVEQAAADHQTDLTGDAEDEEQDRLFWEPREVMVDQLMALPAVTAAEFAAKLIVDTLNGQALDDWHTGALWKEARALVA
ncbi:hypothetical protein ACSSNL_13340 [Thalassobius sp. S69A]|uniref:hypothetical protein n=1 Tax=unclassified Thalassovita TaxID=2619711 RepID=UPI003C7D0CAF